jgi:integrative and conjugative element protein (TIGR02256 family)
MGSDSLVCDVETGGLLIGTLKNPVIFKATKAGINAIKSYASYTNDVDHDNAILKQSVDESGGRLKLLGFWHKHPLGFDKPSLIDLDVARRIIRQSVESGDSRKYYFIITNVVNGNSVNYNCFTLDTSQGSFYRIKYMVSYDNDPELREALKKEPLILTPRALDYWNDKEFSFHLSLYGNERLYDEIRDLKKNGYRVHVYQGKRVQMLIEGKVNIICHMPPEYPLNPPRLFYGDYEIPYPLHVWNSTLKIIDLLEKIQYNVGEKGRIHESNHNERKSKTIAFLERIMQKVAHLWPCPRR